MSKVPYRFIAATLVSLLSVNAAAAETYALRPGDRLDLRVVGLPNLDREIEIGQDGTIPVPLVGRMSVAGKSIDDINAEVGSALGMQAYRQRALDGRETLFAISPTEVSVSILDYRQLYIDGDVESPGAFDFVPGMTAKRLLAMAGGVGLGLEFERDPQVQIAQLQGAEAAFVAEIKSNEARIDRLRSELGMDEDPTIGDTNSGIADVEAQRLASGETAIAERETYLRQASDVARREIELLSDRLTFETEGLEADQEEYERVAGLRAQGIVQVDRLTDARRSVLLSSTRRLETASDLANTERELARIEFDLKDVRTDARLTALADLSDAIERREEARGRLSGVRQQLLFYGVESASGEEEFELQVTIRRPGPDGETLIDLSGDMDAPVLPGDLVTVNQVAVGVVGQ